MRTELRSVNASWAHRVFPDRKVLYLSCGHTAVIMQRRDGTWSKPHRVKCELCRREVKRDH